MIGPPPEPAMIPFPQPPMESPWTVPAEVNENPKTPVLAQATAIRGVPA